MHAGIAAVSKRVISTGSVKTGRFCAPAIGQQTYQSQGVKAIGVTLALESGAQLLDLLILLGRRVARVAVGLNGGDEGEVEVVVLGVEVQAFGVGGSSHVDKFPGQRAE